jgi:DnaJ-domain-containing protein 1
MSDDEIEEDWERENFGISDKERKAADKNNAEYVEFLRDFLNGKSGFDGASAQRASGRAGHTGVISKPPASVSNALCIFDLPPTATWRDVGARYRALAKKYHPDTARDKKSATEEFARITAAYEELKKWLSPNISP